MPILSHPAFGPRAALAYVTAGSLIDVVVTCWYIFMVDKSLPFEENRVTYFVLTTLFLVGLTLLVIGLTLGRIGQSARRAELPPPEVVGAEAAVQQNAAVAPVQVAGAAPAAPAVAPAPAAPAAPAGYTGGVTVR
jgi:hypothetical protein